MREASQKVSAHHLGRDAYLYVRQSTVRQVFENTESSERQYALRRRAVALGWPEEQIVVVDCDQGNRPHRSPIERASRSWWAKWGWRTSAS